MRTAEGGQHAAGFQQLQCTQMNFFVAAQSIRHGCAVARERRRVENDEVETWNDFFVRLYYSRCFQPIEDVDCFKRTFFRKAVCRGISFGSFNRIGALVQEMDVCCSRTRRVQTEPTEIAETIQHL